MYNIPIKRVASEARSELPRFVTDALRTAPPNEHDLIRLAGQTVFTAMDGLDDDSLVELQFHGSDTPSQDSRTFFISMTVTPIRMKDAAPPVEIKPWTPEPIALRTPTEDTAT